ncbi:MAG: hypothetical protein Ct9H300mP28_08060 [Pseudomonadota bacterium]|nr:MAG: hypothetical protein Ct9H300mP28_08060 [Pseudomonadota bacterium]
MLQHWKNKHQNCRILQKQFLKGIGCHGVAEGAAFGCSRQVWKIGNTQKKSKRATCAVAESAELIDPQKTGKSKELYL